VSEARLGADAHIERPSRRRDVLALGLSIVIHAVVLFLAILMAVWQYGGSTVSEGSVPADVLVEEQAAVQLPSPPTVVSAAPAAVAATALPRAVPVPLRPQPVRPVAVVRPRRLPVRPTPPPIRHHELAMQRPSAPPQPTNPPTVPPTTPTPEPPRVPTSAPTAAAVALETQAPTAPPTRIPTAPPTLPPTVAPTRPPSVAPTRVPTLAPTAAPATAPPTVAATTRPQPIPPTAAPAATARPAPASPAATTQPSPAPVAVARVPVATTPAPGTPKPQASGPPRAPAAVATGSPRPAGPQAGPSPGPGAASPGPRATRAPALAPAASRPPASTGGAATPATPAPAADDALARLNARLRASLPNGPVDTMRGYGGTGVGPGDAIPRIPIPADILRATFALLRDVRTAFRAASLTYVYGHPHRNFLGQLVCEGYRITDQPLPTPPPRLDPNHPNSYPDRDVERPPEIDQVDVRCDDPKLVHVPLGSLTTPVPLHP
jgi:hypothetical protein